MALVGQTTARIHHRPATAAIFDMDGLLVDTEPYWRGVEIAVLDELGVDGRPLIGHGLTAGMGIGEAVAFFRSRLGWVEPTDDEVARRIVAGVVAAIEQGAQLKEGAIEALDLMAAHGLVLALASGSGMVVIDAVLDRFGLRSRFATIATALHDPLGKPHPGVLLRTAGTLGVDPTECVVLEDSLNGCIAAKAARMRVIAVPEEHNRQDPRFVLADLVLSSLAELGGERLEELLGFAEQAVSPGGRKLSGPG